MRDINSDFDKSASIYKAVQIYSKYSIKNSKSSSRSYWVQLEDGLNKYEIRVLESSYRELKVGQLLCSEQKQGYLGHAWVKDYYKHDCLERIYSK